MWAAASVPPCLYPHFPPSAVRLFRQFHQSSSVPFVLSVPFSSFLHYVHSGPFCAFWSALLCFLLVFASSSLCLFCFLHLLSPSSICCSRLYQCNRFLFLFLVFSLTVQAPHATASTYRPSVHNHFLCVFGFFPCGRRPTPHVLGPQFPLPSVVSSSFFSFSFSFFFGGVSFSFIPFGTFFTRCRGV